MISDHPEHNEKVRMIPDHPEHNEKVRMNLGHINKKLPLMVLQKNFEQVEKNLF